MRLELSSDPEILNAACGLHDYFFSPDNETWLANSNNLMYVLGDDVGLATYDYPGLYAVHWFFQSRGKEAIKTAVVMLDDVFTNHDAKAVRGVIHMDNKPSRFLAKRLGFERISIEEFLDGPNELILLTKEAFNRIKETINARS